MPNAKLIIVSGTLGFGIDIRLFRMVTDGYIYGAILEGRLVFYDIRHGVNAIR